MSSHCWVIILIMLLSLNDNHLIGNQYSDSVDKVAQTIRNILFFFYEKEVKMRLCLYK
jgi:hypothetical protein